MPIDTPAEDTGGARPGPLARELVFSAGEVAEDDGGDGFFNSAGFFLKFFFIIS